MEKINKEREPQKRKGVKTSFGFDSHNMPLDVVQESVNPIKQSKHSKGQITKKLQSKSSICSVYKCCLESIHPVPSNQRKIIQKILSEFDFSNVSN